MKPSYSIVIPLFNEEKSLVPLWQQLSTVLPDLAKEWEVIFVDDGSTDGSDLVLKILQRQESRIEIIHFANNQGKAAGLQAGFKMARGDIIITLDADLQDDPKEIKKLIKGIEQGYDLVSGWKKERHDPWHKVWPSAIFNSLIRWLSGVNLHDTNCGLKAYRRPVVKSLAIYGELYRFIPVLAANEGFSVTEIPVNHRRRQWGKSKYGISRFMRGFLDLVTVIFLTKFMRRPLHFFGPAGFGSLLAGLVINIYLSYIHFALGAKIGDRPLLLLGILLMVTGLQLVFTGLIGELITYYAQRKVNYTGFVKEKELTRAEASNAPADHRTPYLPKLAKVEKRHRVISR